MKHSRRPKTGIHNQKSKTRIPTSLTNSAILSLQMREILFPQTEEEDVVKKWGDEKRNLWPPLPRMTQRLPHEPSVK